MKMDFLKHLTVFLLVIIFGVNSNPGPDDMTFRCKDDWSLKHVDCYLPVTVPMIWDDAQATCQRQGGRLVNLVNEIEYDEDVLDLAPGQQFWTGLKTESATTGTWDGLPGVADLRTIPLWAANQPDTTSSSEARCVVADTEAGLMTTFCANRELPFICKYPACIEGYVPCANREHCVQTSQLCDGVDHCTDKSDERSCSNQCNYYYKVTATHGKFDTGTISNGKRCTWVIEAPIGKRLRLRIPRVDLEVHMVILEVWTGSADLQKSVALKKLTGSLYEMYVFSSNNFMTVRMFAEDVVTRNSFEISWTTDFPEIPDGVTQLQANDDWNVLESPFYGNTVPLQLRLQWTITSPIGDIITYYVDGTKSVYIRESYDALWADAVQSEFVGTAANVLHVEFLSKDDDEAGFTMKYRKGCTFSISTTSGKFSTPGFFTAGEFPYGLTCDWTLSGGADRTLGVRRMSLKFLTVVMGIDPRTNGTSKDIVSVNDMETYSEAIETSTQIISTGNSFRVKFSSDVAIAGQGLHAEFYVLCDALDLSTETEISTPEVTYDTVVTLSCPVGYKFNYEEYYNDDSVDVTCGENGIWSLNRIPECKVVQCGNPPAITNAFLVNSTGTMYTNVSTYSCYKGFSFNDDDAETNCDSDGWVSVPVCQSAVYCMPPSPIVNGGYNSTDTDNDDNQLDYHTVLEFYCNEGYEIVGLTVSRCMVDRQWNPTGVPICQVLKCPLPVIANAEPFDAHLVAEFGDTVTVTCESGYNASQSVTMNCQSNQTFDAIINCTNIDECTTGHHCLSSTICRDTNGSYICECLPGLEWKSATSCKDILQCSTNNGGCNHTCNELYGSERYTCSCDTGYTLFTADGTEGFYIPTAAGENGTTPGDTYRLGHTCVPVECPKPTETENGQLLSTKPTFHFHENVVFKCTDGYHITDMADTTEDIMRTCTENGWDGQFTCTVRSIKLVAPKFGWYDKSLYEYGDDITLTCLYTQTQNVSLTAHVIYDEGSVKVGGPNISQCPVIDCGNPTDILPISAVQPFLSLSSLYLEDPVFNFMCGSGFDRSGQSSGDSVNIHDVQCDENGRWTLGTLSCLGKMCSDPGTPADAEQIVSAYEIGSTLRYKCNRAGFTPFEDHNYTCDFDENSDTVNWSDGLSRDKLPKCVDTEPPTIQNCPEDMSFYPMELINFTKPERHDNFGVKKYIITNDVETGDIMGEDTITLSYSALDFANLLSEICTFKLNVLDRNNRPSLTCPDSLTLQIMHDNEPEDISGKITSDGDMTFTPGSSVSKSLAKIGTQERFSVTARFPTGQQATCTFMVNFEAGVCFNETLYTDDNAKRICQTTTVGNIECNSTCVNGHIYPDGNITKTFVCTNNVWNVDSSSFCLDYTNPQYSTQVGLTYSSTGLSSQCLTVFETAMEHMLSYFQDRILRSCGVNWIITIEAINVGSGITELETNLTLSTESTPTATCIPAILNKTNGIFDLINKNLACSGSTQTIDLDKVTELKELGTVCLQDAYSQISDEIKLCVPCGPGKFYNTTSGVCEVCADDSYQDMSNALQCDKCPPGSVPDTQKMKCISTCPTGFKSLTGIMPCTPCPVNCYWENAKTCNTCQGLSSTVGQEGVPSNSGCYEPCSTGQYSESGFKDKTCLFCPKNFYQDIVGQTHCKECAKDKVSMVTGSNTTADCRSTVCSRTNCSGNGECVWVQHRPVCQCDPEYTGAQCETKIDICDFNPCNNATCVAVGDSFEYKCACRTDLDQCIMNNSSSTHIGDTSAYNQTSVANVNECRTMCLEDSNCLAASYTLLSGGLCLMYNEAIVATQNTHSDQDIHMIKDCTNVFGGIDCDVDNVDDCDASTCNGGECRDKIASYDCICPSTGRYEGEFCTPTADVCGTDPCSGHGTCIPFNSTRYQCNCDNGYTGLSCETDIDECNPNPCLYGAICQDKVAGYKCTCSEGFSGVHCQTPPDFCRHASVNCEGNVCYNSIDNTSGICHCQDPYYDDLYFPQCIMNDTSSTAIGDSSYYSHERVANVDECRTMCLEDSDCLAASYTLLSGGLCLMYDEAIVATQGTYNEQDIHMIKDCTNVLVPSRCDRTDVEACDSIDCEHGGTCTNNELQGSCGCSAGWFGLTCQHNIDDCTADTCDHGQCVDGDYGNTSCNCDAGYTGDTCSDDTNDCLSNACSIYSWCDDIVNDYICHCNAGFEGEHCEINIEECDSYPCQHGGECSDLINDYECNCTPGWEGKDCSQHKNFCYSSCLNDGICYSTADNFFCRCLGGTQGETCESLTSVCSVLHESSVVPCVNGHCRDTKGTATCSCPEDNAGAACEQISDMCSPNPCQHGGTCRLEMPFGYHCDCRTGYSGQFCENVPNHCATNPCWDGAVCQTRDTDFVCLCPQGQVWTNNLCKSPSLAYTLLVEAESGQPTPTLRTHFHMNTNELSLMMWIRVFKSNSGSNFVTLFGSQDMSPMETSQLVLRVDVSGVHLILDGTTATVDFGDNFGSSITDGNAHHVGVSLRDNRLSCTIDTVETPATVTIATPNLDMNFQVQLGENVVAAYSSVTVWSDGDIDFSQAYINDPAPDGHLAQGWWNYEFTPMTRRIPGNIEAVLYQDVPSAVAMDCDKTPYVLVTEQRVIPFADSFDLKNKLRDMATNDAIKDTKNNFPADFTWGYYRGVTAGFDADNNYADCRFPVYIKYKATCPVPTHVGEYTSSTHCDAIDGGICGKLTCRASNKAKSVAMPLYQPCGALGVYNWKDPSANLVLPTCGIAADLKYFVKVKTEFNFSIPCQNVPESNHESIKNEIRQQFMELSNTKWYNLCQPSADVTQCSNLEFSRFECKDQQSQTDPTVHIDFSLRYTFDDIVANLNNQPDGTLPLTDAVKIIILIERQMDLSRFASAELVESSVDVKLIKDCAVASATIVDDKCLSCGEGMYYNEGSSECDMCPRSKYQDTTGQLSCKDCSKNETTVHVGTTSSYFCVGICPVGYYLETECRPCYRHFYQDEAGQNSCKPCDIGFKTQTNGSSAESDCEEDCPAGEGRDSAGNCNECERGYWRSLLKDDCTKCPSGYTTMDGELAISHSSCSMEICVLGQYFNVTTTECVDCSIGFYQDTDLALACEPCGESQSTMKEGSVSATECLFYCVDGSQVQIVDDGVEKCEECPRGTYKDNNGAARFDGCVNCTSGFTTDEEGATSQEMCNVPICVRGNYIHEGTCTECPMNTYQEMNLPKSTMECTNCPVIGNIVYGTNQLGSDSADDCLPICGEGKVYNNNNNACDDCPVRTYKLASNRFGLECTPCIDNYTTDGEGKTSATDCNLLDCQPGTYLKLVNGEERSCELCDIGSYSDEERALTCTSCGPNRSTKEKGADSEDRCQVNCGPGQEGTTECRDCQEGYFKSEESYESCTECVAGWTSNADRTACPIVFCEKGKGYNSAQDECIECAERTFKDTEGNTGCSPCPVGTTTNGVGQETCDQLFCEPGKTVNSEDSACVTCDTDYYKTTHGNEACSPCPYDDFTTDKDTTTANIECDLVVCPSGSYRPTNIKDTCSQCPEDTFQPDVGSTECTPCPNGEITNGQTGQKTDAECIPTCAKGEEFDQTNKNCSTCLIGWYKDEVDNDVSCTVCPVGKTTVTEGSDSLADCKQDECDAGSGYDWVPTPGCEECEVKWYNDRLGLYPNFCKRCLPGKMSGAPGQTECQITVDPVTVTPSFINITIVLEYDIQTDCTSSTLPAIRANIQKSFRSSFSKGSINKFEALCSQPGCENIVILDINPSSCAEISPPKGGMTYTVKVYAEFRNVPDTVTDTDTLATDNMIIEIIDNNPSAFSPPDRVTEYKRVLTDEVLPVCAAGEEFLSDKTCAPCNTGQYWEAGDCESCPRHSYQTSTGQLACVDCSDLMYTVGTGSTTATECKSYCVENGNYCNNHGTCEETGREAAKCYCNSGFYGTQCNHIIEPTSNITLILGVAIGCAAGLLFLILLAVGIFRFGVVRRKQSTAKQSRTDDEQYRDQYFDMQQYAISNYPPVGYMPESLVHEPDVEIYRGNPTYERNRRNRPSDDNKRHRGSGSYNTDRRSEGMDVWMA